MDNLQLFKSYSFSYKVDKSTNAATKYQRSSYYLSESLSFQNEQKYTIISFPENEYNVGKFNKVFTL